MNSVDINVTYLSNFKPSIHINKNFNFNYNTKLINRNFFVFVLFLKKFLKNKNIVFFIKPVKRSNITLLRSPYRHKLTRHQLTFNRFQIILKMSVQLRNNIDINNLNQLTTFVLELKKFFNFFETNVCNQHKIKFSFFYNFNNFFKLTV